MPHECTNCGHVFPDGSKEMLSGCPDCGGKKFQFKPSTSQRTESADDGSTPASSASADAESTSAGSAESPATADAKATSEQSLEESGSREDVAQASARTEMVGDDDLPPRSSAAARRDDAGASAPESDAPSLHDQPDETEAAGEPDADSGLVGSRIAGSAPDPTPDAEPAPDDAEMERIREELNAQFESIKVLAPGQYELNLMELYDREEYIIALQQNGRYVIEVPDGWDGDRDD